MASLPVNPHLSARFRPDSHGAASAGAACQCPPTSLALLTTSSASYWEPLLSAWALLWAAGGWGQARTPEPPASDGRWELECLQPSFLTTQGPRASPRDPSRLSLTGQWGNLFTNLICMGLFLGDYSPLTLLEVTSQTHHLHSNPHLWVCFWRSLAKTQYLHYKPGPDSSSFLSNSVMHLGCTAALGVSVYIFLFVIIWIVCVFCARAGSQQATALRSNQNDSSFPYHLWLPLATGFSEDLMAYRAKISATWPFTEKVYWPLCWALSLYQLALAA